MTFEGSYLNVIAFADSIAVPSTFNKRFTTFASLFAAAAIVERLSIHD